MSSADNSTTSAAAVGAGGMQCSGGTAVDDVDGIPLSLFVTMSCLAAAGLIYSIVFIVFNVAYRTDRLIKMTSPNINVFLLSGTSLAYISVVLLGLDVTITDSVDFSAALQSCTYLLIFGFTIVYGSLFAKVCRVFMIFSNLNFNGKTSRDEHLLLAVFALLVLDLGILLPWQLVDPVTCTSWIISAMPTDASGNVTSYESLSCASRLQMMWISVVYVYKAILLAVGLYFTWNTRQVTLPALKDSLHVAAVVMSVVILAVTSLPVQLTAAQDATSAGTGAIERYAVAATAICLSQIITVTFLFMPKVVLLVSSRRQAAAVKAEDTQLQFSESMRRTQQAQTGCLSRWCSGHGDSQDKYAVDVLATEIDTLNRTVKEKEATIRELTDRLYVGAEQFQRYLATGSSRRPDAVPGAAPFHRAPTATVAAAAASRRNHADPGITSAERHQLQVQGRDLRQRSRYYSTDDCDSYSSSSDDDHNDHLMTSPPPPSNVTAAVTSSPPRQLSVSDLITHQRPGGGARTDGLTQVDYVDVNHVALRCWSEPEVEISKHRPARRPVAASSLDDSAIDNQSAPSTSSAESRDHRIDAGHRVDGDISGRQVTRSIAVIPRLPGDKLVTSQTHVNVGQLSQGQGQGERSRGTTLTLANDADRLTMYRI